MSKFSNETGIKICFYPHCGPDGRVERPLHGHAIMLSVGMANFGMNVKDRINWGPDQLTVHEAMEALIRLSNAESDKVCAERVRRRSTKKR